MRDEIYPNGTRTRYYTNGTITFLNFDQSVETTVTPPSYIFSLWKDYPYEVNADASQLSEDGKVFNKAFDDKNTAEDKGLYYSVRLFDNGTIWWFLKQCKNDAADLPNGNIVKCAVSPATDPVTYDQRKEALQIRWYQTTGSTLNNTRVVYYTNGTVNRETWTWGTVNGVANTRIPVRDAILVKSPKGDYVPFVETSRPNDAALISENSVISLWLYSKNIGLKREFTNVTAAAAIPASPGVPAVPEVPGVKSTFYYFNDPAATSTTYWDATTFSPSVALSAQQLDTIKNIGEYYIWDLSSAPTIINCVADVAYYPATPTPAPSGDRRCIQIMYRNGS